jgi:hypothetical protein
LVNDIVHLHRSKKKVFDVGYQTNTFLVLYLNTEQCQSFSSIVLKEIIEKKHKYNLSEVGVTRVLKGTPLRFFDMTGLEIVWQGLSTI